MSNLLLIAFPSEEKAEQGRRELLSMEKAKLIAIEDAVIAVKKPDGTIRLGPVVSCETISRERIRIKRGTPFHNAARSYGRGFQISC